jgi:maleylpyruvate isomerase
MKLYNYYRSSSSYRVRVAMNLKGLPFEYVAVHLARDGGEQFQPKFQAVNPQFQVPVLELEVDGKLVRLSQSLAIIEYLDERWPDPPLLPKDDLLRRAKARQLAEIVNSGIQPLQNALVLRRIAALGTDSKAWAREFIGLGLTAYEALIAGEDGPYSMGAQVFLPDLCLIPQIMSARRMGLDLAPFPRCTSVEAACLALEAFKKAAPDHQPDSDS